MARTIVTNKDDFNAGDTNTAFQDAVLGANTQTQIGRYDVPASVKGAVIGGLGSAGRTYIELNDDTTTAVREEGQIIFTYFNPATGGEVEAARFDTRQVGASGQESTPSEWIVIPPSPSPGGVVAPPGGEIRAYFISEAADTLDSTDVLWTVPVTHF